MRYGSICSGIEAATVAWHPLGWEPAFFSEIEKFPRQVLQHHYPDVPLHGDFTTIKGNEYGAIDLLVGGTPCQSFSIAGLRAGLDDPRGNLMLEFGALARRTRPKWLVWENVPGVLSSNGGRDFGAFLGMLAECGYGFAYRILDAQHFGVPQRRRRVFVVGHLGNWRLAAAVLFECHSLSGHPAPRREAGKVTSEGVEDGIGKRWPAQVAPTLNAHFGDKQGLEDQHALNGGGLFVPAHAFKMRGGCEGGGKGYLGQDELAFTVSTTQDQQIVYGIPGNWIGRAPENGGNAVEPMVDVAPCQTNTDRHAVAFDGYNQTISDGDHVGMVLQTMQVRRLTPVECERLQGFPDGYTDIKPNGKPTPDGARYKVLGNSMAVPVMRWIGERIAAVDEIERSL